MNEIEARDALLARAFEDGAGGATWSDDDRAWARRATVARVGVDAPPQVQVATRAALVCERLAARDPSVARVRAAVRWRPWLGWLAATLAFFVGLATDALSAGPRVNLLAPPLLAVLGWNLAVYLLLAVQAAGAPRWGRVAAGPPPDASGPLIGAVARLGRAGAAPAGGPAARFVHDWVRAAGPLLAARASAVLHAAAAALAAGIVAGMYLRGLTLAYTAGWESTFLDAPAVRRLLGIVLGPASALTGIALPDAAALAALRVDAGPGESAARWIHLYAATAALVVIVPRALLWLRCRVRIARLSATFPLALDDPYFQRLLRETRGESARILAVPYAFRMSPASAAGLAALLSAALGTDSEVTIAPPVTEEGADDAGRETLVGPAALVLALFNLSATPEPQTHAAFVAALRRRAPAGAPLVALVDETAFSARFGADSPRLAERRAAWRTTLGDVGCASLFASLGGDGRSDGRSDGDGDSDGDGGDERGPDPRTVATLQAAMAEAMRAGDRRPPSTHSELPPDVRGQP